MKPPLALVLAFFSIGPSYGQQRPPTFKVSVNTICVNVVVVSQADQALPDLNRDDFILLENKKRQDITHFFASDSPRAVGFLIATPCIGEARLQLIREEIARFISLLAPQDRVMLVNFGMDLKEEISLTSDRGQLDTALARLRHRQQPCHPRGAIKRTLERLAASEPGNRLMIMIANDVQGCYGKGGGTPTDAETLELAQRSGVTSYVVFSPVVPMMPLVGWGRDPANDPKPGLIFLRALASRTGGAFFDLSNRSEATITAGLRPALNAIAEELKRHYTLAYSPETGKKPDKRRIEVRVSRPGIKIRAPRKEY